MNLKKHILSAFGLMAATSLLLTGCAYDYIDLDSTYGNGLDGIDEPSLVFDFMVPPFDNDAHSSGIPGVKLDHGEEWENYVDLSKIRVLFCDSVGNYLFEVDRRYISVLSESNVWNGDNDVYRVTIPRSGLYPNIRTPEHNAAIKEAIEQKGFKVAVLANWPNMMEGRPDIDPETNNEIISDPKIETSLDFIWDPNHKSCNSHISYLSHCIPDYVYGRNDVVDDDGNPVEPYSHLPYHPEEPFYEDQVGQMGVFTSWVGYTFKSQKQAATFIRKGTDYSGDDINGKIEFTYKYKESPDGDPAKFTYDDYGYYRTVDAANTYHLKNIWRLWNFSAGKSCAYHIDNSNDVNDYWEKRNENVLIYSLNQHTWPGAFDITDDKGVSLIKCNDSDTKFIPYEEGNTETGHIKIVDKVNSTDVTNIDTKGAKNARDEVSNFKNSAIMFKAYSEGTLRIRAKAERDKDAKIAVLTKIPGSDDTEKVQYVTIRGNDGVSHSSTNPFFTPSVKRGELFHSDNAYNQGGEYIINPNSNEYLEIYIAAVDGDIDIYEIEYMRARHLYDNARNAIMPSNEHPIPMYGIQNFDPVGKYLMPGKTFNLSSESYNDYLKDPKLNLPQYNYKNIYLLRSVAKVELLFDKKVFRNMVPEHVFMRVMNRTARCEPTDVVNPTDWIWYGDGGSFLYDGKLYNVSVDKAAGPDTFVGAKREFENICKYGPLYNRAKNSGEDDDDAYRRVTSWYYGIWSANNEALGNERGRYYWLNPWNWNDKNRVLPNDYPHPRIYNPRIDRSDFCRFHRVPDEDGYYKFIMYMPEKNIDDADSRGRLTATPKVQHIEIRFKDMNSDQNFDDNSHYRIYFTNYGTNGQAVPNGYNRTNIDQVEKDANFLKSLQPVMRNCHYKFVINSINANEVGVNFTVCGSANRTGQTFVIN